MTMKPQPTTTDLALILKRYFGPYLFNQRRVSQHTAKAYRDTFKLLLPFVSTQQHKSLSALRIADISADVVIAFLQHLEKQRHNKVQTRNARLSAIRSFLRYAVTQIPELLADIQPILAIPEKRVDKFLFEYLDKDEVKALLKVQDLTTWFGRRDHALLLTLYNTGARVSEIIRVQIMDVDLQRQQASNPSAW
jgi:integrase/recombinase XerD